MTTYHRDSVSDVIQLMRDSFGEAGEIKGFFDGDPELLGKSTMPAIAIYKHNTTTGPGPTGFDAIQFDLMVKVILDKRQDIGGAAGATTDLTERHLRELVEGRSDTTGLYNEQSVMGILRTYLTLNSNNFPMNPQLNQTVDVAYYVVPRPDQSITTEAHITVHLTEYVAVPNRV